MIRLTKQEANAIGYTLITPWYAIQPIELADGTYIIPKEVLTDLAMFKLKAKYSAKAEEVDLILKTKPIKELTEKEKKDPIE